MVNKQIETKKKSSLSLILFIMLLSVGVGIYLYIHYQLPQSVDRIAYIASIIPAVVYAEGGTFNMGSSSGESEEKPVHNVTLSSFSIGKFPITFSEYDAYCDSMGIKRPKDAGWGRGKNL